MTVSNTDSPVKIYNGTATEYPIPFDYISDNDILVTLYNTETGVSTDQTKDVHYTISDETVIYSEAPGSVYNVVIRRVTPYTQEASFGPGEEPPLSTYESCFDKLTMLAQDLDERLSRCVILPDSYSGEDFTLPDLTTNAGRLLRINEDGTGLDVLAVSDSGQATEVTDYCDTADLEKLHDTIERFGKDWVDVTNLALSANTFSELLDAPPEFKRSDLSYMIGGSAFEWTGERFAPTTKISVRAFGAAGSGDDTAACQAALDYAAAYAAGQANPVLGGRPVVTFDNSPTGVYPTTDTLFISSLIDVEMTDTVLYDGPADRPAMVHGEPGTVTWCPASTYRVARNEAVWRIDPKPRGEETDIGLVLYNFNSASRSQIALATRFEIGFQAIGDGSGFSYNILNLGYLVDNKVQQWNAARNNGWCNENTWNGGRFGRSPSVVGNRSCTAIRTMSYPSSESNINANTWMRPSFEGLGDGVDGAVPVLDLEHSTCNRFLYFRDEGNGPILAREGVRAWDNYWEQGYSGLLPSVGRIDDAGTPSPTSILKSPTRMQYIDASTLMVWDSGDIVSKACHVEGARINVAGMQGVTVSDNENAKGLPSITSGTIHPDGVGYPNRALGILLELPEEQGVPLLVRLTAKGGWASPMVACFDEEFNQLDPATNPGMLRGRQGAIPQPTTFIGGSYTLSAAENGIYFFKTQAYVRYVAVYARLQSEATRFQRMQVFTQPIYGTVRAFVNYPELVPGMNIGAAPPTSGNSVLGKFILNSAPSAGSPYGWRCVEAGNPGVWEAISLNDGSPPDDAS